MGGAVDRHELEDVVFVERARLDVMTERVMRATDALRMAEATVAHSIAAELEIVNRCRDLLVSGATSHGSDRERFGTRIMALGAARQRAASTRARAESERAAAAARVDDLLREVCSIEARIQRLEENILEWKRAQHRSRTELAEHEAIEETARMGRRNHG